MLFFWAFRAARDLSFGMSERIASERDAGARLETKCGPVVGYICPCNAPVLLARIRFCECVALCMIRGEL